MKSSVFYISFLCLFFIGFSSFGQNRKELENKRKKFKKEIVQVNNLLIKTKKKKSNALDDLKDLNQKINVRSERQEVVINDKSYQLSPKSQPNLFDIFFYVNPSHYKLDKQLLVNTIKNQRLDIKYPKYLIKSKALFPEKININAKQNNKFTNIDITTRSVEFNTKLNTDFRLPSGYKEIKL